MDTTPSTAYHSPAVRLANAVIPLLAAVGRRGTDLEEGALMAAARRTAGLERFGSECFLPGLRALLDSLRTEAGLNPFGRYFAAKRIERALAGRLWADACFAAHPEIAARPIRAPLVIVGPARSGTTRLQRMLAADTRFQHLKAWEGFNPAPRGAVSAADRAVRHREAEKILRLRKRLFPGADTTHPMEADWAEEEILLLDLSFCGLSPLAFYAVPGYRRWFLGHDRSAAYRYMADLMRLVSWSRGDGEDKPWVLKTPQHMLDLDLLLKVFPDARLVFIHRDPVKTTASTLSLAWHLAVQHTDRPCRAATRDTWLELCERMARRCLDVRATLPTAQQLDVYYEDMNRDWRGVMARIYGHCGMEFTPAAAAAMAAWLAGSERDNRHGGHRYALEDYGTSGAEVEARMGFYSEKYSIPREEPPCRATT